MKKLFTILIILAGFNIYGQTFSITQTVPIPPISVCTDTVEFQISVLTQNLNGSNNNTLTLDFGPGAHYISNSAVIINTENASTGIPPIISILSENSTNQNIPVFSISNLAFADKFTLSYKLALDCSVIGSSVVLNFVNAVMTGMDPITSNTITKTNNSDQYNAANGVVNILPNGPGINQSPNLSYANAVVGQTYTRTIRIRNGGSQLKSFMFYDTTGVGLTVVPISGGTVLSTTTVGNNVIRVYKISDFTGIGDNDNLFETNETIEVIQQVTVAACTNLLSLFGANFGCYGATSCGNVTGTRRVGGASLNPAVQPNLTVTIRRDPIVCLDEARTGFIVLRNTGTDAATNVALTIGKSDGGANFVNDGQFGYFETSSINYTIYNAGVGSTITPTLTNILNNTVNAAGCGFNKLRQFVITIPLIPAGDSVVVQADFVGCCNETCLNNRYIRDGFSFFGTYTNGCLSSPRNIPTTGVLPRNHMQQEMLIESPTDVNDGDVFGFYIDVTRYFYSNPISPFTHTLEITLPFGIMFSGDFNDIDVLRPNGLPFTTTPSMSFDPLTNKISITFTNTNQMQQAMKIVFDNLMADCSKGSGGPISVNAFLETSIACTCRPQTFCRNVALQLHCPGPCPLGGMINRGFNIQRINIGLPDNDNNGIPDSPPAPYSPFIKDKYAVHSDTLESEFFGIVAVTGSSPAAGFTRGFAIDSSGAGNKLVPISARVIISRSGGTVFTCNNIPVGESGLYNWADFSISNLSGCGYGPTFQHGDTVRVYIKYYVMDATRYSGVFQYPIKTRYYLSDQNYRDAPFSAPPDPRMYYCDNYSGAYGLAGLYDASNGQRSITHQSCDTLTTIMDYFLGVGPSQYYSGGNFFSYEYRPFTIYDTLTITIPSGYSYHRATAQYYYNSTSSLVSITPLDPNANPLVFVISQLFQNNGGPLPVADEGHYIQFRTYLMAGCLANPNSISTISLRQRSIPIGKYDHINQNLTAKKYISTNLIAYNKPNVTITSADPVVQAATDTVTWDVTITNTTPFPAERVWLAEDPGGSIDFINVQPINCSTGALIGSTLTDNGMGVFETGTLSGNSQRCYRVKGKITSCETNIITMATGWNCGSYPANISDADCSAKIDLRATLVESGLNIQIINQPLTLVDLCDTVTYEIRISNPNIGRTEDIQVSFTIPGGIAGLEIIPGSSFLKFPSSTGTYPPVSNLPDPTVSGINYIWSIPNSMIGGSGLDGTLEAPENQFSLRFKARTVPCDAKSGIRFFFNASGISPCGVPVAATQQATQRINMVGSRGAAGEFVVNAVISDQPRFCIQDSTQINVSLLYIGSVSTDGNEKFNVIIPTDYQIVAGSYTHVSGFIPTAGPVLTGSVPEGNVYSFNLPSGVIIGNQSQFNLDISKIDPEVCNLNTIILSQTSRIFPAICSTDLGIMCDITEVTGDDRDTMILLPAALTFIGPVNPTVTCFNFSTYLASNGGYTIDGACGNYTLTSQILTSPACLISGTYLVRWRVTDACGNIDSLDVNVLVTDPVPPDITGVPADLYLSCTKDIPPLPPVSTITVTDDCALTHTVTIVDEITNFVCPNEYTLLRHFIATNECGRKDTVDQVITVVDSLKPQWMVTPKDLFVECSDPNRTTIINNWLNSFGGAMAFDNCNGVVTLTMTPGTPTTLCGGSTITIYEIKASDECGNNISEFANLTIFDNTSPVLTVPVSTTINCTDNFSGLLNSWLNTASSTDGCGGTVNITNSLISELKTCSGTITLKTYTYLFVATDDCGNSSTATSTFVVRDNVPPTIVAPTNLQLTCSDNAGLMITAWLQNYTVTEACQDYIVTNNFDGLLPNKCGGTKTITWTVTDGCGATGTATSNLIILPDNTPPVFANCPSNLTVNTDVDLCGANVIYSTPVATDCNSPVTVVLTSGIASGSSFPLGTTPITFTATDACNNASTCTFNITVVDSDIPTLICPSTPVTVCAGTTCNWTGNASVVPVYIENCPGSSITYSISGTTIVANTAGTAAGVVFNLGTSVVTYTITAANGQTATCSFSVIVNDCTDPVITCPALLVLECGDPGNTAAINAWNATATDNCDAGVSITKTLIYTSPQCCASENRLYQFTATDDYGNTSICTAEVHINDTTAPLITVPASNLTVECDGNGNYSQLLSWLNAHGGAVATDACGDIVWSNNLNGISDLCGFTGSATVTFTATDECGNSSTTTATFTITDNINPVIIVPAPLTLQCGDPNNASIIANWLYLAVGIDACGSATVTNNYPGTQANINCTGSGVSTITFTATDACGHIATGTSTISYTDSKKPVIMVPPADLNVECSEPLLATKISNWVNANGNGMATDDCDNNVTVTFTAGTPVAICGGSTVTPYTFTATDDCGNSVVSYSTLTIFDNTQPVLTLPVATSTAVCDGDITGLLNSWLASVSATDGCGGSTQITYSLINEIAVCDGTTTEIRKIYQFIASDDCGNQISAQDTFKITDQMSPVITAPPDLTLTCGDDAATLLIPWLNAYTVTEACQDYIVTNDFDGTLPSWCGGTTTVTWTVTDGCGATSTASADVIITPDLTPPVFLNCPGTLTVNVDVDLCGANVIYSTPVAEDCNSPVDVQLTSGLASGTFFPLGGTTIVFTATDACGNEGKCTFTIIVEDSDVPQILCPSNDVVVCADAGLCTWTGTTTVNPIGIENCPNAQISYVISGATTVSTPVIGTAQGVVFNLGTSVIKYYISDVSGNIDSCSFNVVVTDCEDPVITCSDMLSVACGSEDMPTWYNTIAATITDNCSAPANMTLDTLLITDFYSCGNTFDRVYMFIVTDETGNSTYCTARYQTVDLVAPVIDASGLVNLTVECNDISNNNALIGWLATHAGLTATDVCSEPVIWTNNFTGNLSDLCANTGSTTVAFTATDACGNTSTETATFTITDTTPPVLTCPQNLVVSCNSPNQTAIINNWLSSANATDECDFNVPVINNYTTTTFIANCGQTGSYTVTFTATDDCNNTTTCQRTITIIDNIPPQIISPALDTIAECGPANAAQLIAWLDGHAQATATDNCSLSLIWQAELIQSIQGCGNTTKYIYRFRVADECTNLSAWTTASFTIIDTTVPLITLQAANSTVECDGTGNLAQRTAWLNNHGGAVANDVCGPAPTWSYVLINAIEGCGYTGQYTYRFTVTDACGNSSSTTATFTIQDTTDPLITIQASDLTVECDGSNNTSELLNWLNNRGGAVATEACGAIIWTNNYGAIVPACGSTGAVTVTFTATDECGKTSTTTATFTIDDTEDPIWEILPQNVTIACNGSTDPYGQIVAWLNDVGGADAEDECSFVTYSNDYTGLLNGCSSSTGSAIVTFTATDACGNFTTAQATVSVVDNVAPVITLPAQNTTVQCDGLGNTTQLNAWLNNHAGAVASDVCSQFTWSYNLINSIQNCGGTGVRTYSFVATDQCGNISLSTIATFTIRDTIVPQMTTLASALVVDCDGQGNLTQKNNWLNSHGGAVASDICSGPLTWTYDLINAQDSCGLTGRYTYKFTVSDACGNKNYTTADFVIRDITPPAITTQAQGLTVQCDGSNNASQILNWLNNHGFAVATDGCGTITWTNNYGTIVGGCGTTGQVQVTFTATDECGNSSASTATFIINDDISPVWVIEPQDLTIECDGTTDPYEQIEFWLNTVGGGQASDDCSLIVYSNDFTALSNGCSEGTGSADVTFTASDACGNTITSVATVTVEDNGLPVINVPARDTTVECDGSGNTAALAAWLNLNGRAQASDLCSEPLTWTNTLISTQVNCGNTRVLRYGFWATDACGNISIETQAKFKIVDTTIPVFTKQPQDLTVECNGAGNTTDLNTWLANFAGLQASDICGGTISRSYDLISHQEFCGKTAKYVYNFTIKDACGNKDTAQAIFTIEDTSAPVITGGADMIMEECIDPPAGNYPEFDYWLTNHAGATAVDGCGCVVKWTNDYKLDNWVYLCGNTRYVDVTFYAADCCGNVDSLTHRFGIGDVTPPEFTNCPRPDIVVDVPTNLCESYVNFSMPYAIDNCSRVEIVQTDTTGLTSGDLFPVGCTILEYTATDSCGNQTVCHLRIIVNDNHTPPVIVCPEDIVTVNDPGICGAVLDSLLLEVTDNCPGNVSVTYEIFDSAGNIIGSGIEDASGTEFPVGENTVVYTAYDQPLIMITEIVQDGIQTGVEIGNFGPAAIDLGCLEVSRENSPLDETYTIVHGNILTAGSVFMRSFTNIPAGTAASYTLRMKDRLIDSVRVNAGLNGVDIFRISPIDTDTNDDFEVVNSCQSGSYGLWNPQLPHYADNGTIMNMQSVDPNENTCQFHVTITDVESPTCSKADTLTYSGGGMAINSGSCVSSVFSVPAGVIADINLIDLDVTVANAGLVTITLTNPSGQQITLLEHTCLNTSNIDVKLDDIATTNVSSAGCSPLGNGITYAPVQAFNTFFGQNSLGNWNLELYTDAPNSGTLNNWTLQFLTISDYDQQDIIVNNDAGKCGAQVSWIHPYFLDNCIKGTMTVNYSFHNSVTGESYETDEILLSSNGTINLDGTLVTKYFEVGVTEVTYTLTDSYGHTSICGFTITVVDNEVPTFPNGCQNFTYQLDHEECTHSLDIIPSVSDNCSVKSLQFYNITGNVFDITQIPIGLNTISAVVTDIYGNKDTCVFTVEVLEYIPINSTLGCNNHIFLSLDEFCQAEINADMILEGNNYRCYDKYCIIIRDENNNIHPLTFNYSDIGKTFMVSICDCLGSGNCCMGQLTIMEKFVPELECPPDTAVSCNSTLSPDELGYVHILNCEPLAESYYSDDLTDNGPCGTPRALVVRTWTVNDHQGNIVDCVQNIEIKRSSLDDVVFPSDILNLNCKYVSDHPDATKPEHTGFPEVDGVPINYNTGLCMFSFLYNDEIYHYCGNSYEILRTWKVRDMCGPVSNLNPRQYVQVLRVFDTEPPVFHACHDITIDAGAYSCTGNIEIPIPMVTDNCNDINLTILVNGAGVNVTGNFSDGTMNILAYNLGLGNHPARFIAKDACNNKSTCEFIIKVVDNSPPIPVCEQYKTVSLTASGTASIKAKDFDSGSFDNCNPVWFKVLRVSTDLLYDGGCPDLNGDDKPSTSTNEVWYDDEVYFCCDDIGQTVMVNMRVFDKDPGDGPVEPTRMQAGGDLYGHYNDCWNQTTIECKIPPQLVCTNMNVSCEASLDPKENNTLYPQISGVCDYQLSYTDERNNGVCEADVIRTWVATGCNKTTNCKQKITITGEKPFDPCTITFPADKKADCPNEVVDINKPTWIENPCNVVTSQIVKEDTFKFVEEACYKILRHWAVIDWCMYQNNVGAENNIDSTYNRKFVCNELVRDGYYNYTQVMMVTDNIPPTIIVDKECFSTSDCFANNLTITATAIDSCNTQGKFNWKYIVTNLDTWQTVQYSYNYLPEPTTGVKGNRSKDALDNTKVGKISFLGSLPVGNYKVEWTVGDGCGNATTETQYFTIGDKKAPTPVLLDLASAVMTNGMVELIARNFDKGGCGDNCLASFDNCTSKSGLYFTFTPVLPNLSKEPQLWALQLSQYGEYYFDPLTGEIATKNQYLNGVAHAWLPDLHTSKKIFLCQYVENEQDTVSLKVYVWDTFATNDVCDDNNYDFGIVALTLNHCGNSSISGIIKDVAGNNFRDMNVKITGSEEQYTRFTNELGNYSMVVSPNNYSIKASNSDHYLNGVTTLDIVLIQKHLLSIKPITDPYRLIAADANGNNKITASDILEIRRVLLGIKEEFSNVSWIGLASDYQFDVPQYANDEFDRASTRKIAIGANQSLTGQDFIAIKVGDINNSANAIENRSDNSISFVIDQDNIAKDKYIEIPVYAKDFNDVYGMQFTMKLSNLSLNSIKSGKLNIDETNYSIFGDKILFSWNDTKRVTCKNDEVLFTLVCVGTENADINSSIRLTDQKLRSEIYTSESLEIRNLKIEPRTYEFSLYQNQPNPFSQSTEISFKLPVSMNYELVTYDNVGKKVKSFKGLGHKGMNYLQLDRSDMPVSGVYYYTLKAGENQDTKKLIFY